MYYSINIGHAFASDIETHLISIVSAFMLDRYKLILPLKKKGITNTTLTPFEISLVLC